MNPGSSLLESLLPLPVLLPLLGAGATLVLARRPTLQRAISVAVLAVVVAIAALLLVTAGRRAPRRHPRLVAGPRWASRWSSTRSRRSCC